MLSLNTIKLAGLMSLNKHQITKHISPYIITYNDNLAVVNDEGEAPIIRSAVFAYNQPEPILIPTTETAEYTEENKIEQTTPPPEQEQPEQTETQAEPEAPEQTEPEQPETPEEQDTTTTPIRIPTNIITEAPPENTASLLCFTLSPSFSSTRFQQEFPELTDNICITELLEGTNITLFWDERLKQWEFATRRGIGAKYKYIKHRNTATTTTTGGVGMFGTVAIRSYPSTTSTATDTNDIEQQPHSNDTTHTPAPSTSTTFRDMFFQVLLGGGSSSGDVCACSGAVEEQTILDNLQLQKTCFYSFLLQHPLNQMTVPVVKPALYLVGVVSMSPDISILSPTEYQEWDCWKNTNILFPQSLNVRNYGDIKTLFQQSQWYDKCGAFLLDLESGKRGIFYHPQFEVARAIRNNTTAMDIKELFFQYLREYKAVELLRAFPNYMNLFEIYHKEWMNFINTVHNKYITRFIKKQTVEFPPHIHHWVCKLHYEGFVPTRVVMRRQVVADYLLKWMTTRDILFALK